MHATPLEILVRLLPCVLRGMGNVEQDTPQGILSCNREAGGTQYRSVGTRQKCIEDMIPPTLPKYPSHWPLFYVPCPLISMALPL